MMIQEIDENIFKIAVPLGNSPLKVLNAYLVRGKDRSLLIDNGFGTAECFEALMSGLRKTGTGLDKMDYFISHRHTDHCGLTTSLAEITSRSSPPKILAARQEAEAIMRYMAGNIWHTLETMDKHGFPLAVSGKMFGMRQKGIPGKEEYPFPFTWCRDGDILEYGGYTLKALSVPGHTPGMLSLYEPEKQLYFAADHILGTISPNITSWHDQKDSLGLYLHSLERIKKLPIRLTLTGHRDLVENTLQRIEQLEEHHQTRLGEVLRILEDGPATAYQVASRMQWSIRARRWEDYPVPQQWFATGEALAHLDHLEFVHKLEKAEAAGLIFFERCI
jgi:glyoxylase-like metal-dependent hydrolase (beta-lactamase superfamily II)